MARIPLRDRSGKVVAYTLVDPQDAALVRAAPWQLHSEGYAFRTVGMNGRRQTVFLHRAIVGLDPGDPRQADHRNRRRLDNRRMNLRIVSAWGQRQNARGRVHSTSRFRGVSRDPKSGRWRVRGHVNGRERFLGLFDSEVAAGRAAAAWRAEHMPYSPEAEARAS
jgi:hypothetical protein